MPAVSVVGFDFQEMLAEASFEEAELLAPWRLELPADHGAHPDSRTETWSLAAHLRGAEGDDVGIQVTLLRIRLVPPAAPPRGSAWDLHSIHRAHVTLFDGSTNAADGEERVHRDVPGVAGHDAVRREIWIDNWSIQYGKGAKEDQIVINATVGKTEISLSLTPAKDAVVLEQGTDAPFRGYAITRMTAQGFVGGNQRQAVGGLAWLEHLWGDVPLPLGPVVWDRLQLHLDDGTDLSLIRTRRRDGGGAATVAGFAVGPDGGLEPLDSVALRMEPTRLWRGSGSSVRYPLEWQLNAGELNLQVTPLADNQLHAFWAPLWSGTVAATGRRGGEPMSAQGTMLLTAPLPP